MKDRNWKDISYLKMGNSKQRKSHEILEVIDIFNILKDYSPVLVGTIPIGIDIDSSDLDLVCKVDDFKSFKEILIDRFEGYEDFKIRQKEENLMICNFRVEGMEIEIYASCEDVFKSNGYRHMVIEYRLLNLYGDGFARKIVSLKDKGWKTEPAFAKVLNLQGDPYQQLLLLEMHSDKQLYELYQGDS